MSDATSTEREKSLQDQIDLISNDAASGSAGGAERFSFPEEEERILEYWDLINAFHRSNDLAKDRPAYTFLDGPPFATGLPHYGHLLAGTIKDVVTRYATLNGFRVERRFGWDCHGLPVEHEIDKDLKITCKEDVERLGGIAVYNSKCREIVMRYSGEWRATVRRMARWIDFDHDYKTMHPSFMESTWWVFSQLFQKGQVYRGYRVMPYSTACSTPLSNFELAQNYKDITEATVTVALRILPKNNLNKADDSLNATFASAKIDTDNILNTEQSSNSPVVEETHLLIWTTTPWTLPSNLAVCVNPELSYASIRIHGIEGHVGKLFIVAVDRVEAVFAAIKSTPITTLDASSINEKSGKGAKSDVIITYEIVSLHSGESLVGMDYEPIFPYYADRKDKYPRSFTVVADSYVTADAGTGLVHMAPAHGEDDFRVCLAAGITGETDVPCALDDAGRFLHPVTPHIGLMWKDANTPIIRMLSQDGKLLARQQHTHSYPHCWRSDTPLIYRAIPCWFVRVTNIIPQMLEAASKTHWVPSFVLHRRFHNWLEGSRDWAVSRNRYWGTPIPVWSSEDGMEVVVIGSIAELEKVSGVTGIKDLHRESVDHITIPSAKNDGTVLRRVEEVLDCWFESGCVPYAQHHYPFVAETKEAVEKSIPADFIAEGLDQTRGWFYTLTVIGVHLFGCVPFKNLIVNGLVLAEDGKKMSKRLKNYPEPTKMLELYGADALRLYLIDSPAVRAEPLRFKESDIRAILRDVLLPWLNAYRFHEQQQRLANSASIETSSSSSNDQNQIRSRSTCKDDGPVLNGNVTDAWILAALQDLTLTIRGEMDSYRLYSVMPAVTRFIDYLTNWYIRLNRQRLRGDCGDDEKIASQSVLEHTLQVFTRLMAPFAPLFAENIYLRLNPSAIDCNSKSLSAQCESLNGKVCMLSQDASANGTINNNNNNHDNHNTIKDDSTDLQNGSLNENYLDSRSVHFLPFPSVEKKFLDAEIVRAFNTMQKVVECGRNLRDSASMSLRRPLSRLVVLVDSEPTSEIHQSSSSAPSSISSPAEHVTSLKQYITDELNVRSVDVITDSTGWGINYRASPNFKILGQRLKKDLIPVQKALSALSQADLKAFLLAAELDSTHTISLCGHSFTAEDICVSRSVDPQVLATHQGPSFVSACLTNYPFVLFLDTQVDSTLRDEGIAREIVNRVQRLRKKANLEVTDAVFVSIFTLPSNGNDERTTGLLRSQEEYLSRSLKSPIVIGSAPTVHYESKQLAEERCDLGSNDSDQMQLIIKLFSRL